MEAAVSCQLILYADDFSFLATMSTKLRNNLAINFLLCMNGWSIIDYPSI